MSQAARNAARGTPAVRFAPAAKRPCSGRQEYKAARSSFPFVLGDPCSEGDSLRQLMLPVLLFALLAPGCGAGRRHRQLRRTGRLDRLMFPHDGVAYQVSSYDRTGGNDDGDIRKNMNPRQEGDGYVVFEEKGRAASTGYGPPPPPAGSGSTLMERRCQDQPAELRRTFWWELLPVCQTPFGGVSRRIEQLCPHTIPEVLQDRDGAAQVGGLPADNLAEVHQRPTRSDLHERPDG